MSEKLKLGTRDVGQDAVREVRVIGANGEEIGGKCSEQDLRMLQEMGGVTVLFSGLESEEVGLIPD